MIAPLVEMKPTLTAIGHCTAFNKSIEDIYHHLLTKASANASSTSEPGRNTRWACTVKTNIHPFKY